MSTGVRIPVGSPRDAHSGALSVTDARSEVVQSVEYRPVTPGVAGSGPVPPAKIDLSRPLRLEARFDPLSTRLAEVPIPKVATPDQLHGEYRGSR